MNDSLPSDTRDEIRASYKVATSLLPDGIEVVLAADPQLADALERYVEVPYSRGALEPKVREFIGLAVNASTTHLFEPAIRLHIRNALSLGATVGELIEVLQLATALGIHTATTGMPILREELEGTRQAVSQAELSDRQRAIKARFSAGRNSWTPLLEDFLRLDPDWLSAYVDYSMVPWNRGAIPPRVKELIYIAIDAQTSHLYAPGTRFHIRNALGYGATADEVVEVLEIVSVIGFHTLVLGMPILYEEISRAGADRDQ
jgi:alkylhydroperoxidase/carboxymuconolactone decarboxylase family protein YurZ